MKKVRIRKQANGGLVPEKVHFEFSTPTAEAVFIAGTFNEWRPEVTPMIALGDGRWAKELLLPWGSYEYCFVVDGHWMPDPKAAETVPNAFGTVNSVLKVGGGSTPGRRGAQTSTLLATA